MGTSLSATWKDVFEERELSLSESSPPEGQPAGHWWLGLSTFERHSFVRLLISDEHDGVRVVVELAAGPPQGRESELALAAHAWLSSRTELSWELVSGELPAMLAVSPDSPAQLEKVLDALLAFIARASDVDQASQWLDFLQGSARSTPDAPEAKSSAANAESPSPFEAIGQPTSSAGSPPSDSEHLGVRQDGDTVTLVLTSEDALSQERTRQLTSALGHYLHARYDVQTRQRDEPSTSPNRLVLEVDPAPYLGSVAELVDDLKRFCERIQEFANAGGNLREYLGLNEVVLPSSPGPRPVASPPSDIPSSPRPSAATASSGELSGVVLDLSTAPSSGANKLTPGDFTDARLQRDDANTPLVDLVLRHPGYSDRRINQVLTILLSIEHSAAERLSESAPCVIAWGLARDRALSFQEVLHSTGARALLVEPGTFGEA
ncbi:hypothetical protein DL240_05885 [Lujinxingia litoralis]|uniref:Uncharacterized protein n=1 Tax=Lujinxingia litoralis TaxID=2211119 RepID=A0A328C9S2_9DELT|nr:hypothetical protein [Lujinxingia litoralis]RAL23688.1 hypothetical protein DL240_05885 [Lujinxingia litoralis]